MGPDPKMVGSYFGTCFRKIGTDYPVFAIVFLCCNCVPAWELCYLLECVSLKTLSPLQPRAKLILIIYVMQCDTEAKTDDSEAKADDSEAKTDDSEAKSYDFI